MMHVQLSHVAERHRRTGWVFGFGHVQGAAITRANRSQIPSDNSHAPSATSATPIAMSASLTMLRERLGLGAMAGTVAEKLAPELLVPAW
jgi:hypothetical protein